MSAKPARPFTREELILNRKMSRPCSITRDRINRIRAGMLHREAIHKSVASPRSRHFHWPRHQCAQQSASNVRNGSILLKNDFGTWSKEDFRRITEVNGNISRLPYRLPSHRGRKRRGTITWLFF